MALNEWTYGLCLNVMAIVVPPRSRDCDLVVWHLMINHQMPCNQHVRSSLQASTES